MHYCRSCREPVRFGRSRCRYCHEPTPLWMRTGTCKFCVIIAGAVLLLFILNGIR